MIRLAITEPVNAVCPFIPGIPGLLMIHLHRDLLGVCFSQHQHASLMIRPLTLWDPV